MAGKKSSPGRDTALARAIFEGLRDEITGGKLMPGEALSRRDIASRYSSSISPAGGTKAGPRDQEGPRLHWQFHRRIAEISRCPALVRELERIELLRRLQANWYFTPEIPDPPRYHSLLVDAIEARDAAEADARMRAHVRSGLEKELLGYRMKMAR